MRAQLEQRRKAKEEILELQVRVLENESLTFSAKEDLKKELPQSETLLSDANFDLFSIARLEGDLTPEQVKSHEAAVENNQQKRNEWQEWQQTKLQATHLEYEGKAKLKKRTGLKGRIIWISVVSAAAAVALPAPFCLSYQPPVLALPRWPCWRPTSEPLPGR